MENTQKIMWAAVLALLAVSAYAADVTTVTEKDYQLPKCTAPVASVVVGKISCKSANCQGQDAVSGNSQLALLMKLSQQQNNANFAGIGEGMTAMLTTVLKETGCFDIQEREAMEEIAKELALVGKKVDVQQADFMISGAITSINMTTEKSRLGGGFIPIIGMISTTKHTADVGMDMKIIDINKSRLLDSKTFIANNETSSYGFGAAAFVGVGLVGGGFSSVKGTPMEGIVRDILARVSSFSAARLMAVRGSSAVPAGTAAPSAPEASVAPTSAPASAMTPSANGTPK